MTLSYIQVACTLQDAKNILKPKRERMKLRLVGMCAANCIIYCAQASEPALEKVPSQISSIAVFQKLQSTPKVIKNFTVATCKTHPVYASCCAVALVLSIAYVTCPSLRALLKRCLEFQSFDNDISEKPDPEVYSGTSIEDSIAEHIVPAQAPCQ